MEIELKKRCCHCHEIKAIDEFGKNRSKKDGHQEYCRPCAKYYRSLWRRYPNQDPEAVRLYRASPQYKWYQIKYRAIKHNIPFTLTRQEYTEWFNRQDKVCHYCRTPLDPTNHHKLNSPAIDRKENGKGYTLDNIILSCMRCNTTKGSWLSEKQMIEIAHKYFMPSPKPERS